LRGYALGGLKLIWEKENVEENLTGVPKKLIKAENLI